jgi:hypothetical protein
MEYDSIKMTTRYPARHANFVEQLFFQLLIDAGIDQETYWYA